MKIHTLEEFAQALRVGGDNQQADFGTEILELVDLEAAVAEPYSDLCADLEYYAPDGLKGKPEKVVEWLADRAALLDEIEKELKERDREPEGTADTADAVREALGTLDYIADTLDVNDAWEGDMENSIKRLCERPKPMEYDL
jgi:hypothetical protein